MKLSVSKEYLLKAVSAVGSIVPAKSTMPILQNVLLDAEETGESSLKLAGTDLDISLSYRIPATVDQSGSITVPARKLIDVVKVLPNEPIKIEKTGDQITIKCGKKNIKLPGLPRDDYPSFPQKDFSGALKVSNAVVRKLVSHSGYAAGTDDDRPILKGVFWEIFPDKMSMVSTNGHRLAKVELMESLGVEENISVVVPPKSLELVDKLFSDDGELEMVIDKNHIGIREGDIVIFSRLIEGTYPNYEQVIPFYNTKEAFVNTEALADSLRLMLTLANTITHRVRLQFGKEELIASVNTEDEATGNDSIPVEYDDEELEIYFNGNYLMDVLKFVPGERVKICMQSSESGILIVPGDDNEKEKYYSVIMPLKVKD